MIWNGVIAVVIAYLLGSFPTAYIITRLATGKDIRKLGGGNAGAGNVFRELGLRAAIPVTILDVGKGVVAVAIANWVLAAPPLFVLLAAIAAVAGHIWSIYLKFNGGNGLSVTLGVLSLMMAKELAIVLGIMIVLSIITRNPILSLNLSFISLPISGWLIGRSWLDVVFPVVLMLMVGLHFLPTARAALAQAGSRDKLIAELFRIDETAGKKNGTKKRKLSAR